MFHFQIFQLVTTQISDSIVSELQKRGDLEQCLQAIGQECKVAWQRSGSVVTMTCDLEELCHAQNCFKQVRFVDDQSMFVDVNGVRLLSGLVIIISPFYG